MAGTTWSGDTGSEITSAPGTRSAAGVRIGDTEREQAATALGAHLRAGRLAVGEYDERLQAAFAARTAADVTPLFTDLPGGSPLGSYPVSPDRGADRPHRALPSRALIVGLLIASAVWVVATHLPPFFLFPLLWFFVARRTFHPRRQRHAGRWPGPGEPVRLR